MNKKRFFAALLLFFLCLGTLSCEGKEPNYLAYLQKDFCAEVEGRLHGVDFCARIEVNTQTDPENGSTQKQVSVTYLSPTELNGICVTVLQDLSNGTEKITASLGEITLDVSHESVQGWLLPAESLLSVSKDTLESLQKTERGYRLIFPNQKILAVDERGMPLSLQSDEISFSVTQIQPLE